MKPKKEDIQRWIDALRSGEYAQTKEMLQNANGYCCLGVACELFIPEEKQRVDLAGYLVGGMPWEQPNAPRWLSHIPNDFINKTARSLAGLNDDGGLGVYGEEFAPLTFEEIADLLQAVYIECVLEGV